MEINEDFKPIMRTFIYLFICIIRDGKHQKKELTNSLTFSESEGREIQQAESPDPDKGHHKRLRMGSTKIIIIINYIYNITCKNKNIRVSIG